VAGREGRRGEHRLGAYYYQATAPLSEEGGYINFMAEDDQGRIRANYRGNYDRLAEIKARYDPGNLFRHNQNIAPGGAAYSGSSPDVLTADVLSPRWRARCRNAYGPRVGQPGRGRRDLACHPPGPRTS
jgi:hypothetical protein